MKMKVWGCSDDLIEFEGGVRHFDKDGGLKSIGSEEFDATLDGEDVFTVVTEDEGKVVRVRVRYGDAGFWIIGVEPVEKERHGKDEGRVRGDAGDAVRSLAQVVLPLFGDRRGRARRGRDDEDPSVIKAKARADYAPPTTPKNIDRARRKAAQLVVRGWCQNAWARNAAGGECDVASRKAKAWSGHGAVRKACGRNKHMWFEVEMKIEADLRTWFGHKHLDEWNDLPERTRDEVRDLLLRIPPARFAGDPEAKARCEWCGEERTCRQWHVNYYQCWHCHIRSNYRPNAMAPKKTDWFQMRRSRRKAEAAALRETKRKQ